MRLALHCSTVECEGDVGPMMRILKHVLEAAFVCGLAVAYIAAAAGLIGWMGSREVAAFALFGGGFSFIIAVAYFIIGELEIKHWVSS
jgi:hypothetical protein